MDWRHLSDMKDVLDACKERGVRRFNLCGFEVEFFDPKPAVTPMPLDPVSLSKTLTDTMPPDSAMLFAATEDPAPEKEEG